MDLLRGRSARAGDLPLVRQRHGVAPRLARRRRTGDVDAAAAARNVSGPRYGTRARARDWPLSFRIEAAHAAGSHDGRSHGGGALRRSTHTLRDRARRAAADDRPADIYLHRLAGVIRATIARMSSNPRGIHGQ